MHGLCVKMTAESMLCFERFCLTTAIRLDSGNEAIFFLEILTRIMV